MNTIQMIGRLTKDPEARTTPNQTAVCGIRLAVDRMGRGSDETGYVDVTSFGPSAEAANKVLAKGWLVAVTGRLQYSEWETAEGQKRNGHQVVGHIEFLAAPKGSGQEVPDQAPAPTDEDIPF